MSEPSDTASPTQAAPSALNDADARELSAADEIAQRTHDRRKHAAVVIGIPLLLALLVRSLYLFQTQDSVLTQVVFGDARSYDTWAQVIAGGDWIGSETFYQAPAYPYFLAIVYSIFGHSYAAVRVVQIILGLIACGLMAWATSTVFSKQGATQHRRDACATETDRATEDNHRRDARATEADRATEANDKRDAFATAAGVIAGCMLALYPPAIFFDGIIQKASLGLFLLCVLLACAAAMLHRPRLWLAVACGAVLALLALTRENALAFAPLLAIWLLWWPHNRTQPLKQRSLLAGMFFVGLLLVLLPVAARNAAVGDGFALTTSQLGPNFYIGNNAGADGTYKPLVWGGGDALVERHDAKRLAEQAAGRELTWPEVSDYWRSRTFDEIGESPGRWLGLMVTKVRLLVNHAEVADTEAQQVYEDQSALLRALALVWGFGPLLALAAFGAAVTHQRWRQLAPLYLMMAGYAAAVVAFYVMARYRFPLAPLMMPLAAGGIAMILTERARLKHQPRALAVGAIAAVVLALISFMPMPPQTDAQQMRAVTYSNVANALAQKPQAQPGDVEQAVALYDAAIDAKPDYAKAYNGRGVALAKLGQTQAAFRSYRQAIELKADYADAMFNLAVLLERDNEPAAAEHWYRQTIAAQPSYVEAYVNLGRMYAGHNRFQDAFAQYQQALAIDPHNAAAHNNLGTTLARAGNLPAAIQAFEKAVELDPDYADARANLQRATRMIQAQ